MSVLLYATDGLRPWAQRLARWLLLALLLATLAPGISRTLSALSGGPPDARPGEHWVELCTSQGMQWVRVDLDAAGDAFAPDPESLDRCGHCTLAADRFAPLIPVLPVLPAVQGHWPVPVFVAKAGAGADVRAALARGPPLQG